MSEALDGVTWYRQLSVCIHRRDLTVYVDPNGIPDDAAAADFVLLTHPHYDVFSEADIERVRTPNTVVIAPTSMKKLFSEADHFVRPGDFLQLGSLDLLAVPAYTPDSRFHPPEAGWLGYLFTVDGITYYHAGDTGLIPAMEGLSCDVAFLPCDGHYSMGPEEAAEAGKACGASLIVPIHWGDARGRREDAERLGALFDGDVVILERAADAQPPPDQDTEELES
jgi:L-ascorbate metabolism protein UlaG (beta-lactamase superfamily)